MDFSQGDQNKFLLVNAILGNKRYEKIIKFFESTFSECQVLSSFYFLFYMLIRLNLPQFYLPFLQQGK